MQTRKLQVNFGLGQHLNARIPVAIGVMRRETFEVVYYHWKQHRMCLFAGAVNSLSPCASPLSVTVMPYENNCTFDAVKYLLEYTQHMLKLFKIKRLWFMAGLAANDMKTVHEKCFR